MCFYSLLIALTFVLGVFSISNPSSSTQDTQETIDKYEKDFSSRIGKADEGGNKQWDGVSNDIFRVSDEIETLYLDQIDSKINDFEDLKTQAAVIDRHLRKHSSTNELNSTDLFPTDLDGKDIETYEEGLRNLKKKIITSEHEMDVGSVQMINSVVDRAAVFLETSREMVENLLDDHLASEGHRKEHEHGEDGHGHSEDRLEDYADLISIESEVEILDEELLIEYIDMDIEDLENLKEQKFKIESHIHEHMKFGEESDELSLAEDVLQGLTLKEVDSYEESLKAIKKEIQEANGTYKVETIDHIANTIERAEIFLNASIDTLNLAEILDDNFEGTHKSMSKELNDSTKTVLVEEYSKVTSELNETFRQAEHETDDVIEVVKVDKIVKMGSLEEETNLHFQTTSSPVNYSDVTAAGVDKSSDEESLKLVYETNLTQGVEAGKEDTPVVFLSMNFSVTLAILSLVVLVVVVVAFKMKLKKKKIDKDDGFEKIICANPIHPSATKNFRSCNQDSELESVKDDNGWNSKKWSSSLRSEVGRKRRR